MKLISPEHYYSQASYEKEIREIFSSRWVLGCLTNDIPNPRDYLVVNFAGHSVIMYNNGASVKAFQNVCPHRYNSIFTASKGNDRLVCKYHLWGFDENGKLLGQSEKKLVLENQEELICLKEYAVSIIGAFIFIHLGGEIKKTLKEQVGVLEDDLLLVSEILGEKLAEGEMEHKANWKFIVENITDNQHCKALHQNTLVKSGLCANAPELTTKIEHNSFFIIQPLADAKRAKRDAFLSKYLPRKLDTSKYKHILFFPNFAISIYEGLTLTIGQLLPLGPELTSYKLRFFNSKIETENTASLNILAEMRPTTVDFSFEVYQEDRVVLERVQQNVKQARNSGYVYQIENRVQWFTESYNELMGEA